MEGQQTLPAGGGGPGAAGLARPRPLRGGGPLARRAGHLAAQRRQQGGGQRAALPGRHRHPRAGAGLEPRARHPRHRHAARHGPRAGAAQVRGAARALDLRLAAAAGWRGGAGGAGGGRVGRGHGDPPRLHRGGGAAGLDTAAPGSARHHGGHDCILPGTAALLHFYSLATKFSFVRTTNI